MHDDVCMYLMTATACRILDWFLWLFKPSVQGYAFLPVWVRAAIFSELVWCTVVTCLCVCLFSLLCEQQASWHLSKDGLAYQATGTTLRVFWQLPHPHGVECSKDTGIISRTECRKIRVGQEGTGSGLESQWERRFTTSLHSGCKTTHVFMAPESDNYFNPSFSTL